MSDFDVMFKDSMFVYAAESVNNPQTLKVTVPEAFLDKSTGKVDETRLAKGSTNIFINENPPALSNSVVSKNYITLPVIGSFTGSGSGKYYADGGSHTVTVNVNTGIGQVNIGDRLVASFIGNSPDNGVIIARC